MADYSSTVPESYRECLGSDKIRLFQMAPRAEGQSLRDISGTLGIYDFDKVPSYAALSYTWGDPDAPEDTTVPEESRALYRELSNLTIDGNVVPITTNLSMALAALNFRFAQTGDPSPLLWIDAICINQSSTVEKSAQVDIMCSIYGRADLVVVWLGLHNDHTTRVLEIIEQVGTFWIELCDKDSSSFERAMSQLPGLFSLDKSKDKDTLRSLGFPDMGLDEWNHIRHFLLKSWFRRAWTLQEIANARSATFMWGPLGIAFEAMAFFVECICDTGISLFLRGVDILGKPIPVYLAPGVHLQSANVVSLWCKGLQPERLRSWIRALCGHTELNPTSVLFVCLNVGSFRDASDPRDMIFSLFGLVNVIASSNNFSPSPSPLASDYSKDLNQLCKETCRYLLEDSISILSAISINPERSAAITTPYWVCDFDSDPTSANLKSYSTLGLNTCAGPFMNAAAVTQADAREYAVFEGQLLILQGFCVAVVEVCAEHDTSTMFDWTKYASLEEDLEFCCNQQDGEDMRERAAETFCKVLTAERRITPNVAWETVIGSYRSWMTVLAVNDAGAQPGGSEQALKKWLKLGFFSQESASRHSYLPTLAEFQRHMECLAADAPAELELDREMNHFMLTLQQTASGKRLFKTAHGHCCLGPSAVQRGDEIWILKGGLVPYVLRPVESQNGRVYRVVGDAYVDGIMYGEAVIGKPVVWTNVTFD